LFRESCSHYVYRITRDTGLVQGLCSLRARVRSCRPGYVVSSDEHGLGLVLCDGSFLPEDQVAQKVMEPIRRTICGMESALMEEQEMEM